MRSFVFVSMVGGDCESKTNFAEINANLGDISALGFDHPGRMLRNYVHEFS
jgi:hypothetical protein